MLHLGPRVDLLLSVRLCGVAPMLERQTAGQPSGPWPVRADGRPFDNLPVRESLQCRSDQGLAEAEVISFTD
jgi:hypothetical protein